MGWIKRIRVSLDTPAQCPSLPPEPVLTPPAPQPQVGSRSEVKLPGWALWPALDLRMHPGSYSPEALWAVSWAPALAQSQGASPAGEEGKYPFVCSFGLCSRVSGDKSQVGRGAWRLSRLPRPEGTGPRGCAQASPLPTLLLLHLGDPPAHSFFCSRAGFRVHGLWACWARACAREARLWAPRDEIRTRRLRHGPDRAAPRGPLRGVRPPQSSPNGNPARLGAEAGGAGRGAASPISLRIFHSLL